MKNWHFFFLALSSCALAAALIPWIYNRSQYLTAKEVQSNREKWQRHAPGSYGLKILRLDDSAKTSVLARKTPHDALICRENGSFLEEAQAAKWTAEGLFAQLDRWLIEASADPAQHYLTARFHPQYGIPIRIVFRSKPQGRRVEIQVAIQEEIQEET